MSEFKAGFDVSQLAGTNLAVIQQQSDDIASPSGSKREYLSIVDGKNKFRFYPAHPNSDGDSARYAQQKHFVWLKITDRDDESKRNNRSFLNAREHAGQKKDLIEEYHRLATEQITSDDTIDTAEKARKLKTINGFQTGINHQGKFLAYAVNTSAPIDALEGRRGLIELTYGQMKQLQKISLAEQEEDPTGADIISHPTEGVVITINKDPKKPNTEKYSVTQGRKAIQLTQEDADWWISEDSLVDILTDVNYHKGTIAQLLDGIQDYDDTHEIGISDTEEFEDIYEELFNALPDAPVRDDDSSAPAKRPSNSEGSSAKKRAPRKVVKTLGEMDKSELKEFIIEYDLDVRVLRKTTVEEILDAIEFDCGLTSDNYPKDFVPLEDSEDNPLEDGEEGALTEEVEEVEEEVAPTEGRRTRRAR